ncbi:MAG TPA: hypothetical protein VK302_17350 [Terriglobales bacterium]|nr:hypothetical protein [Terriglobales bacterium]
MFFGEGPDHLENHLPDITRRSFQKLRGANGQSALGEFSMLAKRARAGNDKLETFDSGSTFFSVEGPIGGSYEKMYATVERDDLAGDEDQIELALHMISDGKEETLLPIILRFTFAMKMETEVWRLNVSVRASTRLTNVQIAPSPAILNSCNRLGFVNYRQTARGEAGLFPATAASRTPLWRLSGWGCRGRRLSTG